MDVGDGVRLPLATILSHNGIPQFRTNPMNYNYTGNDHNHPGYVSVRKDENTGKENHLKHCYEPAIEPKRPSQNNMQLQRGNITNSRSGITRIR